ncbi:peptidase S24/S26A/S26B/S26C [Xylariales sp. AK1849]|nr:peptidase S24/S26A/S26B/S26C [Xylariales sp. AK1849]
MAIRPIWARLRADSRFRSFGRFNYHMFVFATWIPVVITFNTFVADLAWIEGPSMYPFFNAEKDQNISDDMVLNWKFNPQDGLERGMIVTFWNPYRPEVQTVKRIVGLEGDIIRTHEPYQVSTIQVPRGHVWVEGDGDRRDTLDSNTYGPISTALIIGKVTRILYPFHRAGRVKWEEFARKIRN